MSVISAQRGTTRLCQPLGVAYMRAFKAELRRQWFQKMAREVLEKSNPIGQMISTVGLNISLPCMVLRSFKHGHTQQRVHAAWHHIFESDVDEASLVAEANSLHAAGLLREGKEAEGGAPHARRRRGGGCCTGARGHGASMERCCGDARPDDRGRSCEQQCRQRSRQTEPVS